MKAHLPAAEAAGHKRMTIDKTQEGEQWATYCAAPHCTVSYRTNTDRECREPQGLPR